MPPLLRCLVDTSSFETEEGGLEKSFRSAEPVHRDEVVQI
jgi:hypothetical protein